MIPPRPGILCTGDGMKKQKKDRIAPKTDPRLAASAPTAESPEFVPLTPETADGFAADSARDIYDLIPELKDEKKYR